MIQDPDLKLYFWIPAFAGMTVGEKVNKYMFNEINEPIEVVTLFKEGKTLPLKFFWHGREVAVKTINLAYSSWEGRNKIYYFAVSDSSNYFKLRFNTENLKWTLLESYTD